MTDSSPTKSASFSPETWYRKAYEESRSGSRPIPEGAGSMPGSSGTPSPGSGISSPGSFSGSPVTVSPGISTGSPGSLGGSPGFGTGSPASGSGSSPGSERGIWCENCNARLVELKRQAFKLLIPGPHTSKVGKALSYKEVALSLRTDGKGLLTRPQFCSRSYCKWHSLLSG
ncbi:Kinesin-like protein KIF26B [Triplophysa tibetana]|uniref:Kinesin-like protein KIF26B n=1 Tax=Triplophysa tibetana TaxID=1572043 RepID=A0A5A9NPB6_9TELE|nr:Kinesin-like protein KIF26B [Triplophysa tibetana]